jgi:ATP-dependent Clp protease protease subunit
MLDDLNKSLGKTNSLNSFCLCFGEVDEGMSQNVIQFIIENNFSDKRPDMLNLVINSPGGSLADAFAMIDVMRSSVVPIRTIGLGQIASAGLMLFMAGTKGERVLTPSTSIMSHSWAGGSMGKEGELFAVAREFELTAERMRAHYKLCTGLKEKDINKYLLPPHDVFLSAEEAKKLNLCDRVALLK